VIAITERAKKEVLRIIKEQNLPSRRRCASASRAAVARASRTRWASTTRFPRPTRSTSSDGVRVVCDPKSFLYLRDADRLRGQPDGPRLQVRQPERLEDLRLRRIVQRLSRLREGLSANCQAELETPLACSACGALLLVPARERDAVRVLGIEPPFELDRRELKRRLLSFSRLVHPDFFATEGGRARGAPKPPARRAQRRPRDSRRATSCARRLARAQLGGPDESQRAARCPRRSCSRCSSGTRRSTPRAGRAGLARARRSSP
jgi:Fe-S cluster assembly iron-binding protein IscA